MSMIKGYQTITAETVVGLDRNVMTAIRDGWLPTGGIAAVTDRKGSHFLCQAVMKLELKPVTAVTAVTDEPPVWKTPEPPVVAPARDGTVAATIVQEALANQTARLAAARKSYKTFVHCGPELLTDKLVLFAIRHWALTTITSKRPVAIGNGSKLIEDEAFHVWQFPTKDDVDYICGALKGDGLDTLLWNGVTLVKAAKRFGVNID